MSASDEQMLRTYETVTIRIFPASISGGGDVEHRVELTVEGWRTFPVQTMSLGRSDLAALGADPKAYGLMLGQMVFGDDVLGTAYAAARAAMHGADQGLRIRLRIDDPSLQDLRWERVYHPVDGTWLPLGATAATPFSRFLPSTQWERHKPMEGGPLRMLAIISSPRDLADHGLDPITLAEQEDLRATLGRLDNVEVTYLQSGTDRPPTLDNIQAALTGGAELVHYLGHGRNFIAPNGSADTLLYLEDGDGLLSPLRGSDLVTRVAELAQVPTLWFLAACESASGWQSGTFVPLGPALVAQGRVPAVIAMTDRVSLQTAQRFARHFYERLLAHGLVDLATNQARAFVQDEWDWGTPVLFTRVPDGRLLAPDPIRAALQAIQNWQAEGFADLPLKALRLVRNPVPDRLEWLEPQSTVPRGLMETALDVFAKRRGDRQRGFLVLIGAHGTARSTHVRRIARQTAQQSLSSGSDMQTLPVYVDLRDYASTHSAGYSRVEVLMCEGMKPFWPGLTVVDLRRLLRRRKSLTFRILFDGSDDLPDPARRACWREIRTLFNQYERHEVLLITDPDAFEPRLLGHATDLLVVQPLSRADIERFLRAPDRDWSGPLLLKHLEDAQLFDLVSSPWLLFKMLQQATEGRLPDSRRRVLENLVEDALAEAGARHGMRARAGASLNALAWQMQSSRATTCSIAQAFAVMDSVRGSREYQLEDLLDELVRTKLLTRVGEDRVRFTYPAIQAFCCARAIASGPGDLRWDAESILDDITASLGRPSRVRWWEDTIVLLAGLMADPNNLLSHLVYGTNLIEGEEAFLAARCVVERGAGDVEPYLIERIIDGLLSRLDSRNEPRPEWRARAVHALGSLRHAATIPHLARAANYRVRPDWRGELDFELSSVRRAAALALLGMMTDFARRIETADGELFKLLQCWQMADVAALKSTLLEGDEGSRAIAAFALGDLGAQVTTQSLADALASGEVDAATEAVQALFDTYRDPESDLSAATRWALDHAFAELDADLVTQQIILPFLDAGARDRVQLAESVWNRRASHYARLAYLIGKIRTDDQTALAFLTEGCLKTYKILKAKGRAMVSLGWLNDRSHKWLFEQVAIGNFQDERVREQFALSEVEAEDGTRTLRLTKEDQAYLRQMAMEALAYLGDEETIQVLRRNRAEWGPDLLQTFYRTSEEIFARLNMAVIERLAWQPPQGEPEAGSAAVAAAID